MLINKKNNKKAQIGDTITWVVATIIIIVILVVSIFIVSLSSKNRNFSLMRNSDLLVTKSLVWFLSQESNQELTINALETETYLDFDKKFKPFLESLSTLLFYQKGGARWNLGLFLNDENKHIISTSPIPVEGEVEGIRKFSSVFSLNGGGSPEKIDSSDETDSPDIIDTLNKIGSSDKIELKFWKECPGDFCEW